jgi:flagellar biosynthesis protein FliR
MIVSVLQAQLFFLALTRVMAVIIHIPVLGGQAIPNQYRLALGVLLAMVLIPWQPVSQNAEAMGLLVLAAAVLREIIIGTLVGFAAELSFSIIQIAADAMGLASGFSSSHIFNPALGDSSSAYNQLFVMVATLVFLVINGQHGVIIALQRTFVALPVNNGSLPGSPETLIRLTANLIAAGVQLSLPVICALLLTDLTFGLLARVAPNLQVYFLGLPIKVGVALAAMSLVFGASLSLLKNIYLQIGPNMLALLGK